MVELCSVGNVGGLFSIWIALADRLDYNGRMVGRKVGVILANCRTQNSTYGEQLLFNLLSYKRFLFG
jgi:predicted  nucleic acid-binding Zn ribbon protein